MPEWTLTTPTGEEGESWGTAIRVEEYLYDPTVTSTTTLSNGMVVILYGGYTFSTNTTSTTVVSATAVPVIRKATTTPGYNNVGVVVNAPTAGYVPGTVVQVCVEGVAQVLCDANTTTFGNLLIAGSTTAGAATAASSPTEGKTIAVCLQTASISSGTALVYGKLRLI